VICSQHGVLLLTKSFTQPRKQLAPQPLGTTCVVTDACLLAALSCVDRCPLHFLLLRLLQPLLGSTTLIMRPGVVLTQVHWLLRVVVQATLTLLTVESRTGCLDGTWPKPHGKGDGASHTGRGGSWIGLQKLGPVYSRCCPK
jgi:hypothetical protein